MSTESFIHDLALLSVRIDGGMIEFDEPPPDSTSVHIRAALTSFGEEAVPIIHNVLTQSQGTYTCLGLLEALGEIGHASSLEPLIIFHKGYSDFMSSLVAVQSIRRIGGSSSYSYLASLIKDYARGNHDAVYTRLELVIAIDAMEEWQDEEANTALKAILDIADESPFFLKSKALQILDRK